jgi:hypothetical protein
MNLKKEKMEQDLKSFLSSETLNKIEMALLSGGGVNDSVLIAQDSTCSLTASCPTLSAKCL